MALFIQLAEHRDTQALHAKMDELLRAVVDADNETAKMTRKNQKKLRRNDSKTAMK
ncbi:low affinity iron permease family protein [Mesorhizobium sp. M0208]|uniref:low affinity iron permease family protein n=1 Tax=unclassified Mesorhizobium TaxID=325217 RepID=UPI00333C754E